LIGLFPSCNSNRSIDPSRIRALRSGNAQTFAVLNDNSLWVTGFTQDGIFEDNIGIKFTKVMDNVQDISIAGIAMILRPDGGLYSNENYFEQYSGFPDGEFTKIMDNVSQVESGAHILVLQKDNKLWGIGANHHGSLGDGTGQYVSEWKLLAEDVIQIAGGGAHSAILKSDGSVWTSGLNSNGQLGIRGAIESFTKVLDDVNQISAGSAHTLAIKKDGTLWATGSNESGQIGSNPSRTYEFVKIFEGVKSISAYGEVTMIVSTDNDLYTLGENDHGQLGIGTFQNTSTPTLVLENVVFADGGRSQSFALTSDGKAWAAGWNFYGQLGDGTTEDQATFVEINID